MIRIFKTKETWQMIDDRQSLNPFVYDDIRLLIEDLQFLLEAYYD